jgi:hypothetical protein
MSSFYTMRSQPYHKYRIGINIKSMKLYSRMIVISHMFKIQSYHEVVSFIHKHLDLLYSNFKPNENIK